MHRHMKCKAVSRAVSPSIYSNAYFLTQALQKYINAAMSKHVKNYAYVGQNCQHRYTNCKANNECL